MVGSVADCLSASLWSLAASSTSPTSTRLENRILEAGCTLWHSALHSALHHTPPQPTTPHHTGVPGVGLGEPDEGLELPGVGGHLAPPRANLDRCRVQGGQVQV